MGSVGLACAALIAWAPAASAQTRMYTATWASVDAHTGAPAWFQDAKLGVYFHWGAFSVPAFYSEWYPSSIYDKDNIRNTGVYAHHMQMYGDPYGDWPYEKFFIGANDKKGNFTIFAPKTVANGGKWDPDAWAALIANSGARFAGPVAEHHDGFSMWDSKVNPWNSVAYGPKLNLAALHAAAIRKRGLKLLISQHTVYNFTGYWTDWGRAPAQTDPRLQQLYGQLPKDQEETIWLGKLKEVIDEFLPDVIYQDNGLAALSQSNLLEFLSHYYNAAAEKGVEVVALGKDAMVDAAGSHPGQVYDYERGGPRGVTTPYWITDDSLSPQTWGYVSGMALYNADQLIDSFVDHVAKGGNLLVNIMPMADGTIPQAQQDLLNAYGSFLHQNGEAIYKTRAWTQCCEGPTTMGGGFTTYLPTFTSSDVRYTRSQDGDALYALLGGWPGGQVNLTTPTTTAFPVGNGKVFLFPPLGGSAISLTFTQDGSGLHVTLPSSAPYKSPLYALKVTKSGTPPMNVTPWPPDSDKEEAPDAGASDAGVSDAGVSDAGVSDAGVSDAGASDAGASDAGGTGPDAGAGRDGASTTDASGPGPADGGASRDGGSPRDAGARDGGHNGAADEAVEGTPGCGCGIGSGVEDNPMAILILTLGGLMRRRRRR
jgi:alpha-L-fucosidase